MSSRKNLKCIVVGNSGVGKTCLLHQFNKKEFIKTSASCSHDVSVRKIYVDNQEHIIEIWDTAGQERFNTMGGLFYRGADCCVIVFDVTNKKSFQDISFWRNEFIEKAYLENPQDFPGIVLGNKSDLDDHEVTRFEATKWSKLNNMIYYETSAKDGRNLEAAFEEMVTKVQKRNREKMETTKNIILNASNSERIKRQEPNCCNSNTITFQSKLK